VAFFVVVVAEEYFLFRRGIKGYDLTAYNNVRRLPLGVAGILACLCGTGMAVVSMAQVWYTGPLGRVFGPHGGDLGFEMCGITTAIVYPPLRWAERRFIGR
jgi:purine-cytosine permease-like protein